MGLRDFTLPPGPSPDHAGAGARRAGLHHRGQGRPRRRPARDAARLDRPSLQGAGGLDLGVATERPGGRPYGRAVGGDAEEQGRARLRSPTASSATSISSSRSASSAWCRGFTPRDIVGYWLPKATDVTIRIGDVAIAPGDYMVGDRDGLIRVPKGIVETVIEKAEAAIATESLVRTAILSGVDPQEAYLKYGKFKGSSQWGSWLRPRAAAASRRLEAKARRSQSALVTSAAVGRPSPTNLMLKLLSLYIPLRPRQPGCRRSTSRRRPYRRPLIPAIDRNVD